MIKEGKVNCFGVKHHIERDSSTMVDESLLKNDKSPAAKEARKDSTHLDVTNVDVNKSNKQQQIQNQEEDKRR